jgi:hypothetical protein
MPARFHLRWLIAALAAFSANAALAQDEGTGTGDGVSLGLDARLRYELVDPTAFGSGPQDQGGYLLWRIAPRIEAEVAPGWDVHVQLFAAGQLGRAGGARGNDRNDLDLTQAYVEWRPGDETRVRAGRQEMALGSGRLLAAFDGANVRRRFDGLLFETRRGDVSLIALAASPVLVGPGVFDDESDFNRLAVGLGVVRGEANRNSEAVYAIRTQSFAPLFGAPPLRQERFTIGARVVRTSPVLFAELEGLAQFGNSEGDRSVRAWALAGELRAPVVRSSSSQLLVGAKFSLASGDSERSDRVIGGFDPLFPNPVFTGSFPFFAPTNMASINPAVSWEWDNGNRIGFDVAVMQRLTTNDQIYALGGAPITTPGNGKTVGALWAVTGSYRLNDQVSLNGALVYLDTGNAFAAPQRGTTGAFLNLNVAL